MASSFRHLLDFLPEAHANVDSMHSPPKLTSSAGPVSLGFLKIGRGHLVNGDIFPPFPLIPHLAVARGPGAGNIGNAGNVSGGDPSETCHLVSV